MCVSVCTVCMVCTAHGVCVTCSREEGKGRGKGGKEGGKEGRKEGREGRKEGACDVEVVLEEGKNIATNPTELRKKSDSIILRAFQVRWSSS